MNSKKAERLDRSGQRTTPDFTCHPESCSDRCGYAELCTVLCTVICREQSRAEGRSARRKIYGAPSPPPQRSSTWSRTAREDRGYRGVRPNLGDRNVPGTPPGTQRCIYKPQHPDSSTCGGKFLIRTHHCSHLPLGQRWVFDLGALRLRL